VKRLLQWLLKIFFAATIAFEIPLRSFASVEVSCTLTLSLVPYHPIPSHTIPHHTILHRSRPRQVLARASVFSLASIGKVATGLWAMPLRRSEFFKVRPHRTPSHRIASHRI
jgi:hypothetical protein